jgi:integrase
MPPLILRCLTSCLQRTAKMSSTVHVVAARLGHAGPAVTLRVYSHVLHEHAAGIEDIFAQAVKASVSTSASQTGKDDQ